MTVISSLGGHVTLTGVNLFLYARSGSFFAPPDASAHWDDGDYNRRPIQEFGVGTQFENGLYGFLFHESCWSVLERAFHPEPVPLGRLYEVCLSMPMPLATKCINWGHDYGGLHYWQKKPYLPWDVIEEPGVYSMEDLVAYEPGDSEARREWEKQCELPPKRQKDSDDDSGDDEWTEPTLRVLTVTSDPYHVKELRTILLEQPKPPPMRRMPYFLPNATTDLFSRLPQELRAAIATHLSTADFFNGRLALRGLGDIFNSQQFWATRFLEDAAERSWIFESHQLFGHALDWHFLYKRTSDTHLSQSGGIRNRRRVWELALRLKTILSLNPLDRLPPFKDATEGGNAQWITAQADICSPTPEQPHKNFFGGPKGIYLRNLVAIRFHFSHELYGIDFRYNDDYVPDSCYSIGRHKCPGRSCYGDYEFDIDGPGGELVASIEISLFTSDGNEDKVGYQTIVVDMKIETNRGRSFRLTNKDFDAMTAQSTGKVITRSLEATNGTTITGLYAHQFHGMRSAFMTLGVMSEAL
ncbi:hypothetical protein INS49_004213 [Diaporthe citri]|uniref:uncharacterized protein n=1 Tax=Diaporthe citri TaxID=83186 RepID=UPI001C7ED6BD|nr:uncharacterized protein INS49_004213 [Diaporthe citri]KAG6355132.1 hypothetical protein INS49_004213 [Diaporthe citri]